MNKTLLLFLILIILSLAVSFTMNTLVLTDDVYYYFFMERFPTEKIGELLELRKENALYMYFVLPVVSSLKILMVAICLFAGVFFANIKGSFSSMFKVVINAEFIFLLATTITIIWFGFIQEEYTLNDIRNFSPFSLYSVFGYPDSDFWLKYILKMISLFQIMYVLLLAEGLRKVLLVPFTSSLKIVTISYGLGFILWITMVLFIIVSFS